MTTLLLLLLMVHPNVAPSNEPHIKAAIAAYQAGKAALLRKQPATAAEFLSKAIEIEPTFLEAYGALIDARMAADDTLEAAAAMTRFLEIAPEASHYRIRLGTILLAQKEWDRALAQFSLVLRDSPLDADALFGLATAAKQLGMKERASEALVKGRSRYPQDQRFRRQ